MQTFYKVCLILMIIGGINWGLVGLFQFDFVGWLLGGSASIWSRIVFTLVGLAALCGIPLVIGENVGGGDNKTEFNPDGSIRALPDLDRRIAVYRRYYNGKGALFVQLNANDAYNGVADYVARKYGDFVCVEIKWGQGAKPINGEGLIRDLDYARFMKSRSYCLRPDPEDPAVQEAFRAGRVKHFTAIPASRIPPCPRPRKCSPKSRPRRNSSGPTARHGWR